jgi:Cu-Zn family superoxide dismutase
MTNIIRTTTSIPALFLLAALSAQADEQKVAVNAISPNGVGDLIGTIQLTDSSDGLVIKPVIEHLKPGNHGFHVHEKASCDAALKDGAKVPGLAAGGHFDPKMTGKHLGPQGGGHMGDLPVLEVDESGKANKQILVPRLTLAEIKNHALIIHEGGDNYSDEPKPLGGGGVRVACGVIH